MDEWLLEHYGPGDRSERFAGNDQNCPWKTSPADSCGGTTQVVRCAAVGVLAHGVAAGGGWCFIHAYVSTPPELLPLIAKWYLAALHIVAAAIAACVLAAMVRAAREKPVTAAGFGSTAGLVTRCAAVGVLAFAAAGGGWFFMDAHASASPGFLSQPGKGEL